MLSPYRAQLIQHYVDWLKAADDPERRTKWPFTSLPEFYEIDKLLQQAQDRDALEQHSLANEPAAAEVQRLRKLIEDTAKEWQRLDDIPFEGGIDAAMRAGVDEIVRLRAELAQVRAKHPTSPPYPWSSLLQEEIPLAEFEKHVVWIEALKHADQEVKLLRERNEQVEKEASRYLDQLTAKTEREPTVQADLFDVKFGKVSTPPPVGDQAAKARWGNWTYEVTMLGWGQNDDVPARVFVRRTHQDGRTMLIVFEEPFQFVKAQNDEISKLKDELDLARAEVQKSQCTLASFRTAIQMLGGKLDQEGNVTVHYGSPPADVLGEKFHTALGKARQDDDVPASIYNAVKHLSDVVTGLLRRIPS